MSTAQEIRNRTGGYISAAPLGNIAGVSGAFGELLSRVQALPFVPAAWSGDVRDAMDQNGGNLWVPAYATTGTGAAYPDVPSWLTSDPNAALAWNKLVDWWASRLQPILKEWARDEAEVLTAAYDDVAFWNTLYAIVKPVAAVGEAIIEAPAAVAEGASKALTGVLGKVWPWLLLAGVAVTVVIVVKGKLTKPPAV